MISFACHHCGKQASRATGHVNRQRATGMNLYCSRKCSGLARRKDKTKDQLVAEKREYDAQYRIKNRAMLKAKKASYFQRTYDPVKAAEHRKTRMPAHVEYCRRPAYKQWKIGYDRRHRARKQFGDDYSECFLLLQDLETEIASRMTKYEIMLANGTICKAQKRRREYESLIRG